MATKTAAPQVIDIEEIERGFITVGIVGTTPFVANRMQNKGIEELLFPKGPKTAADKAANLKHNPPEEFRGSPYLFTQDTAPTYIAFLASAFRNAIGSAALDMPGAKKAQVLRLVWVEDGSLPENEQDPSGRIPMWGLPRLHMSVVRSADMNRTPDIRTRCCLPEWGTLLRVWFPPSLLREKAVANLLGAAGVQIGVGDGRNEKGKLRFGCFRVVNPDDPDLRRIMKEGGRAAQIRDMDQVIPYDEDAEEMLAWWRGEIVKRGVKLAEAA